MGCSVPASGAWTGFVSRNGMLGECLGEESGGPAARGAAPGGWPRARRGAAAAAGGRRRTPRGRRATGRARAAAVGRRGRRAENPLAGV